MVSLPVLLVGALAFVSHVCAAGLSLSWPTTPEQNNKFSLQWSGGQAPYIVYVLTPDLKTYYYKYTGSALVTYYNFPLNPGTQVAFQVVDATNLAVTSPPITVVAELSIKYPTTPQQGVTSTIQWSGGLPPYTVYVLTTDLQEDYWKYTGSATSATYNFNINAGTQVVFQAIDSNGIKATGKTVTIGANPGAASQSRLSASSVASVASIASIQHQSLVEASLSSLSVQATATLNNQTSTTALNTATSSPSLASVTSTSAADIVSNTDSTTTSLSSGTSTTSDTASTTASKLDSTTTTGPAKKSGGSSNAGAIAGGVVGGILGLAIIAAIAFFLVRRRRQSAFIGELPSHAPNTPQETAENPFHTPAGSFAPVAHGEGGFAAQPPMGYGGQGAGVLLPSAAAAAGYGNPQYMPNQPQYGGPQMAQPYPAQYPVFQNVAPPQADAYSTGSFPSATTNSGYVPSQRASQAGFTGQAEV